MSEIAPSSVVDHLESALAVAEPMCLAIVQVEPAGVWSHADPTLDDLAHLVKERMVETLRRYDQFVDIDDHGLALILRTLADATLLTKRMQTFFDVASAPYELAGAFYEVRVVLGAAVRRPQDTPTSLLDRVEQALDAARTDESSGLVVI